MAERLLLEGGSLEELMAYVRTEFGPRARIVRADRVRSGGIAGFFAKEKFELTVDVPPEPVPLLRPHRAPPSSMQELLAAADAADGADSAPDPFGTQAAILAAPDGAASAARPRAATGGQHFATVLDQVRTLADAEATSDDAPFGGHPALPREPALPTVPAPSAPPVLAAAVSAPAVLSAPAVPQPPAVPSAPTGSALRTALSTLGVPAALLGEPATLASVLARIPRAAPIPRRPGQILLVVGTSSDLTALEPMLVDRMRLGPSEVVHVGTGLRYDPVLAGADRALRITSPVALAAWRSRAPSARHPWLVLMGVEGESEDRALAADLVEACRPTAVWAVVDARTKVGDARRWLAEVGARRPVDAVAARAVLDTSAPGTLLDLGTPVAWVDGLPTSPVVWAAVLGQALDAALG